MLSHRFQTVFVHVPKAAGQSIETVFLDRHGLAWKQRAELLLRPNQDRTLGPERLAHLYAREYVECGHVAPEIFARYFKFGVVRNPYERAISQYRFRVPDRSRSLPDFLRSVPAGDFDGVARSMAPQVRFLCGPDERIAVDEVFRYENLEQEIGPVFRRIFGSPVSLPHINRSADSGAIAELSGEAADLIYRRFEMDFDFFHYPTNRPA